MDDSLFPAPRNKLVIVDNFDHNELDSKSKSNRATVQGGHHVRLDQDRLEVTGWKEVSFSTDEDSRGDNNKDAVTDFIPKGTRYYLPSDRISSWEQEHELKERGKRSGSKQMQKKIFVSNNSIWTADPDEPILEETVHEYDHLRRVFYAFLAGACICGSAPIIMMYTWAFAYSSKNVTSVISKKLHHGNEERANRLYVFHGLIMIVVFVSLGFSTILYRIFPHVSKFILKCIHGMIGLLAALAALGGMYPVFKIHEIENPPCWRFDVHGALGFLTLTLLVLQFIFGFSAFMWPVAAFDRRVRLAPVHKFTGGVTFIVSSITTVSGLVVLTRVIIPLPEYSSMSARGITINVIGIIIVSFGVLETILISDHRFRRRQRPEFRFAKDDRITMLARAAVDADEERDGGEDDDVQSKEF